MPYDILEGLKGSWDAANKPLTNIPSRIGQAVARPLTDWGMDHPGIAGKMARGAGAFGESLGDTLSGMTSPLSLGLTMASGGAAGAARQGAAKAAPEALEGLTGALQPLKPTIRGLGESIPEFAPVGGESALNAGRAVAPQAMNPVAEEAFSRYTAQPAKSAFRALQDAGAFAGDKTVRNPKPGVIH